MIFKYEIQNIIQTKSKRTNHSLALLCCIAIFLYFTGLRYQNVNLHSSSAFVTLVVTVGVQVPCSRNDSSVIVMTNGTCIFFGSGCRTGWLSDNFREIGTNMLFRSFGKCLCFFFATAVTCLFLHTVFGSSRRKGNVPISEDMSDGFSGFCLGGTALVT